MKYLNKSMVTPANMQQTNLFENTVKFQHLTMARTAGFGHKAALNLPFSLFNPKTTLVVGIYLTVEQNKPQISVSKSVN